MRRSIVRSPGLAALLSFVLPGLGQVAAGRVRRGLLAAVPALAVLTGLVALTLGGRAGLVASAFDPDLLAALLVLDVAALCYHVWAVGDAYWIARKVGESRGSRAARGLGYAALVAALVGSVAVHLSIAQTDTTWRDALLAGFGEMPDWLDATPPPGASLEPDPSYVAEATATVTPSPTPTSTPSSTPDAGASPTLPATPSPTPAPTPTPKPTAHRDWGRGGRFDLLVIGSDAGPDRWMLRTDTMILVSVDLSTGRAAMFGIPRNLTNVPLPTETAAAFGCHCFPGMLNALYVYAMQHPDQFPGGQTRGFRALEGAVSELTGIYVDGSVVINLAGFVKLVNALGGLDINVSQRVVDPNYPLEDGSGWIKIDIRPGRQHLDGRMALAYARSRHQDSDYGRMQRQQEVLLALRAQLKPCQLVTRVQPILNAVKGAFWTDMPMNTAPQLLAVAQHVNPRYVGTYAFVPPSYPEHLDQPSIDRIRYAVAHAWDGLRPAGGGGGWDPFAC